MSSRPSISYAHPCTLVKHRGHCEHCAELLVCPLHCPILTHIQVQWYERKANLPLQLQTNMHDREVLESDMTDTNLVGCIDRKAAVFRARSYEEVGVARKPVGC
jgi:hypothetical protein